MMAHERRENVREKRRWDMRWLRMRRQRERIWTRTPRVCLLSCYLAVRLRREALGGARGLTTHA
jgi:hypothetical protein